MNTKITASEPGSHLPGDSRAPGFKQPRRPPPDGGNTASLANDCLTIEAPPSRYTTGNEAGDSEVVNAISLSQTQDGFLQIVQKALDRMGELSVLSRDAKYAPTERSRYTSEFTQLQNFISDVGTKQFNGVALFSEQPLAVRLESGGPTVPLNAINFNAPSANGGLANAFDPRSTELLSDSSAVTALSNIRKATENLGAMQAKVGANLKRLALSGEQVSVLNENLSAANSQIQDIDQVKSLTQFARFRMLGQSGAAMMAQANAFPQTALKLLD